MVILSSVQEADLIYMLYFQKVNIRNENLSNDLYFKSQNERIMKKMKQ